MATEKKVKLRKNERLVKVLDKHGQVFEVAGRNAYDLINHKGWKLQATAEEEVNEQAHSPRAKKEKGLPKGLEKPEERKKRTRNVPVGRNKGPGPEPENPRNRQVQEAVLDDLDELDEGNESSDDTDASLAELDD